MPLKLVITLCVTFFVLGAAGLYLMVSVILNEAVERIERLQNEQA